MNRFRNIASLLAAVILVCLGYLNPIEASTISIDASGRGWIYSNPFAGGSANNGNTPVNNYLAGSEPAAPAVFRNHFDYPIPTLPGTLVAATLSLDSPVHAGVTHSYSVSSLGPFGTYSFGGIGAGTAYGGTIITASGPVNIALNPLALTAIAGAQGGTFSIGGVNSGESLFPATEYDFAFTASSEKTRLILQFTPVPEPSSAGLASGGSCGLLFFAIVRRRGKARRGRLTAAEK